MLVQEMIVDNDMIETQDVLHHFTPMPKLNRSDVYFPLTTPRKRAPSISSSTDRFNQDGQSLGRLTITGGVTALEQGQNYRTALSPDGITVRHMEYKKQISIHDLPLEVQGKVLDYIFGDMHSVYATSTSLRGKNVSSLMRHPRRKAVSDFALVSSCWREMVQERIYRHIKIKGTRAGLAESEEFFYFHSHLTKYIRHIEFWVPVWGDKASLDHHRAMESFMVPPGRNGYHHLADQSNESLMTANDLLGFNFKLSVYSATLSQIFTHIGCFFPEARVFTLEGGHCKKSNMIRHFPKVLFSDPNQSLDKLPNIRTFAMRGAWNIMRQYTDWKNVESALPNVEEWHCGYAKPRIEADATINQILRNLPLRFRHVNISLDGMYSKDPTTLGSNTLTSQPHLCEQLGSVLPQLESLSFTGKICECLWKSALETVTRTREEPRLKALEIVVKSCCRQRVTSLDPETGEMVVDELGGVMADGAGITNLVFIRAFERLILNTIKALKYFPHLEYVRIRFIDLDSPCTLLNPYWHMQRGKVMGIWNEEIVEILNETNPDLQYEELGDGIDGSIWNKEDHHNTRPSSSSDRGSATALYPKWKPRSIKSSSYKILAETRGS